MSLADLLLADPPGAKEQQTGTKDHYQQAEDGEY